MTALGSGVEVTPMLTAADRCDRCSAAALVRVDVAGSELMFCGHHYGASADALAAAGGTVAEDRRS